VQDLVQIVRRRRGIAVRPQLLQQHIPMHLPAGREGEELHQRTGLAQAPLTGRDGHPVPVHLEAAEQADAHAAQRNDVRRAGPSGVRH